MDYDFDFYVVSHTMTCCGQNLSFKCSSASVACQMSQIIMVRKTKFTNTFMHTYMFTHTYAITLMQRLYSSSSLLSPLRLEVTTIRHYCLIQKFKNLIQMQPFRYNFSSFSFFLFI